jgi:hypothetical protein
MRQDFFEFRPQFKLIIAGNHKPGLRSVDEATRRRFHLIPFNVTIPPHERDQSLTDLVARPPRFRGAVGRHRPVRKVVAGGALGLGPDGAASPALCFPTEPNFRSD